MRIPHLAVAAALALGLAACGGNKIGGDDAGNGDGNGNGDGSGCQGLACYQVNCPGAEPEATSVSGTVYAPNGWLELYNVDVYVPTTDVPDYVEGQVSCDRCSDALPGNPLIHTTTDTAGHFQLKNMPVTPGVKLVIQVGKWRRIYTLDQPVAQCTDTPLDPQNIRLPKNSTEGHLPKIALTTGGADALECLLRKVGISDSEFGIYGDDGKRVHLFYGNQTSSGGGTPKYDSATDNGASFTAATDFWNDPTKLEKYDVVLFSCEGAQNTGDKPQGAIDAVNTYANAGGRVFASHWHNYWLQATPSPAVGETVTWPSITTWDNGGTAFSGTLTADINPNFSKGPALTDWLVNVGASTTAGLIDLKNAKHTLTGVDETTGKAEKWVYLDNPPDGSGTTVQYTSFTTSQDLPENQRCGKVVFSDIHVSSGASTDRSNAGLSFPSGGCTSDVNTMSAQEKVLAFMIFDISSCVGPPIP